jgi:hypothetical protein
LPSVDTKDRSQTLAHADELVKGIEERISELKRIEMTGKGPAAEVSTTCYFMFDKS